jgi:DNA-3-methyladenine glycosylase I
MYKKIVILKKFSVKLELDLKNEYLIIIKQLQIMPNKTLKTRCSWVNLKNPLYIQYHDEEWGRPIHDDHLLFELLCLEGAQAGLSWETILNKRQEYRKCFWNFDIAILISKTDEELLARIQDFGVIKNRLKTLSVKKNALAYLKIVEEQGSLDNFLWSYVGGEPIVNRWTNFKDAPVRIQISDRLSKDLKKYGFSFVGPVICYAFMQSCGMVSDHQQDCWCVQ